MTTDADLLQRYAATRSEAAFAELVQRHVNLVYSAALRQVNGDAHLAQDVSQTVFTDLARKAGSLARGRDASSPLTGWLYTSAHFAAAKMVRGENRRRDREEKFMRESENSGMGVPPVQSANEMEWEKLSPVLDAAMQELKESDREAVLLRYFENRQFAEVGARLGLNENAARMRVERALEKLRTILGRRGVAVTATLATVISANAVQLAPAGLAVTLAGASLAAAGTGAFLKFMTLTKLKLAFSALVVAGATTALVVQHQAQERLRTDNESLTQQIAQLKADNESLSNRFAAVGDSKKLTDEQINELLKLRGEVGLLQQNASTLSNKLARASNPNGLTDEQMPPVYSSSAPETASAYARLVKKQAMGQLTAAEEYNLLKAWPYLEKRFNEPDSFANFQSQYLAKILNVTNTDAVWQLRRLLENAREQEHAHGLRWARLSDEDLQRNYSELNLDMQKIRAQWNDLNQKTTQEILEVLPEQQQSSLTSVSWPVLDFDSRLKYTSHVSLADPRFQNLTSQEIFDAYMPPNPNVRYVPGKVIETK